MKDMTTDYQNMARGIAKEYGVNEDVFFNMINQESNWNPSAISGVGAKGLGQIMDGTARLYGVNKDGQFVARNQTKEKLAPITHDVIYNPELNLRLSAMILKDNLKLSKGNYAGALAWYNGGAKGGNLFAKGEYNKMATETQDYLKKILGNDWESKDWSEAGLSTSTNKKTNLDRATEFLAKVVGAKEVTAKEPEVEPKKESQVNAFEVVRQANIDEAKAHTTKTVMSNNSFFERPWGQGINYYDDPEVGDNEYTGAGFTKALQGALASSLIGGAVNYFQSKDNFWGSEKAFEHPLVYDIYRKTGYDYEQTQRILNGMDSEEAVKKRARYFERVQEFEKARPTFTLGGDVGAFIGDMGGDPATYIPIGGGAVGLSKSAITNFGKGVALGALSGATSNQFRQEMTGAESNFWQDTATFALWGGGLSAGLSGSAKGLGISLDLLKANERRGFLIKSYTQAGQELPSELKNFSKFDVAGARKFNDSWEKAVDSLPDFQKAFGVSSFKKFGDELELESSQLLWGKIMSHGGEGYNIEGGRQRVASADITAEELLNKNRNVQIKVDNAVNHQRIILRDMGYDDAVVERAMHNRLENHVSDLDGLEPFEDMIKTFENNAGKDGLTGYMPHLIDQGKVTKLLNDEIKATGTDYYGAQNKMVKEWANYLYQSIRSNSDEMEKWFKTHVWTKRVEERLKEIEDLKSKGVMPEELPQPLGDYTVKDMQEYFKVEAYKTAKGYIDQNYLNRQRIKEGDKGFKYDHNKERIPWNLSYHGKNGLVLNDFRQSPQITYRKFLSNQTGDDIARQLGFEGEDGLRKALADMVANERGAKPNANKWGDESAKLIDDLVDTLYGRNVSERDNTLLGAVTEALRNVTYTTSNGLFFMDTFAEQAEAVRRYGAGIVLKSLPFTRTHLAKWNMGKDVKGARQFLSDAGLVKQFQELGTFKDTFKLSFDRNIERFNGNKALAFLVSSTKTVADFSPFTQWLRRSEQMVSESVADAFMGELVRFSHKGIKEDKFQGFLTQETLKRNNITQKDFDKLTDDLRASTTYDPKTGEITIKKDVYQKLVNHGKNRAILERLGEYTSLEVVQQNTLSDTMLWKGSSDSNMLKLIMQFKTFSVRSYGKRFRNSMVRASEGDTYGQFLTMLWASVLGAGIHSARNAIRMVGLDEEDRNAYLERAYGINDKNSTKENVVNATINSFVNGAIGRSSHLASPTMLLQYTGLMDTFGKNTLDNAYGRPMSMDKILSMTIPAYQKVNSMFRMTNGLLGLPFEEDDNTRDKYYRDTMRGLKGFANIPVITNSLGTLIDYTLGDKK